MKRHVRRARRFTGETSLHIAAKDLDLWEDGEITVVVRARLTADGRPRPALLMSVSQLHPDESGMPEARCGFSGIFFHRELGDLKETLDAFAEAAPILRAATSRMFDESGDLSDDDLAERVWMSAGVLLLRGLSPTASSVDVTAFLRRTFSLLRWFTGLFLVDIGDLPHLDSQWLIDAGFRPLGDGLRFFYLTNT